MNKPITAAPEFWRLQSQGASALISPWGGQLVSLKLNDDRGQAHELLWQSPQPKAPPAALRGGVPICWPWFGPAAVAGDPQHGWVRTAPWGLVDKTADSITLAPQLEGRAVQQCEYLQLQLHIALNNGGQQCDMQLTTSLAGHAPAGHPLSMAFHTYVLTDPQVPCVISGLSGTFQDNLLPGRPRLPAQTNERLVGPSGQAIERLYDDLQSPAKLIVQPESLATRAAAVALQANNARSVMIWNPGPGAGLADAPDPAWQSFVCVEIGHLGQHSLVLEPGASNVLHQTLGVFSVSQ
jgi:glucose-6-phosphate 1-epimerase